MSLRDRAIAFVEEGLAARKFKTRKELAAEAEAARQPQTVHDLGLSGMFIYVRTDQSWRLVVQRWYNHFRARCQDPKDAEKLVYTYDANTRILHLRCRGDHEYVD